MKPRSSSDPSSEECAAQRPPSYRFFALLVWAALASGIASFGPCHAVAAPQETRAQEPRGSEQPASEEAEAEEEKVAEAVAREPDAATLETEERIVEMSLREAILAALTHNLSLRAERLRGASSALDVFASYGVFDPVLFSNFDHTDFEEPTSSQLDTGDTEIATITGKRTTFDAGVRSRFVTGLTAELRFDQSRDFDDRAFRLLNPTFRSNLGLSVTQPLLRGGGIDVNLNEIRLAKTNLQVTNEQFRQTVEETILLVVEAYWELSFSERDIRVKEESLALAENEVRITDNKVRLGLWAQLELDQALTEQYSRRAELVAARQAYYDALDTLRRLIFALDDREEWNIRIQPSDELREVDLGENEEWLTQQQIPEWTDSIAEAFSKRPEIRQAQLELRTRELEGVQADDDLEPVLDIRGSYTWSQLSEEWEDNVRDLWFPDAGTWAAGLSFEYPIGNRTARARANQVKIERRRASLLLRDQENVVVAEVREAIRAIRSALERIRFSHRAFLSAEKQLRAAESRRDRGFLTNFEVLEFQRDLAQAAQDRNETWKDYRLARARLERAKGSLLEAVGVVLDDVDDESDPIPRKESP